MHSLNYKRIQNFTRVYVARCALWYQTLKNGVLMVGQNAVLTSGNVLEELIHQKSVSQSFCIAFKLLFGVSLFAWHERDARMPY